MHVSLFVSPSHARPRSRACPPPSPSLSSLSSPPQSAAPEDRASSTLLSPFCTARGLAAIASTSGATGGSGSAAPAHARLANEPRQCSGGSAALRSVRCPNPTQWGNHLLSAPTASPPSDTLTYVLARFRPPAADPRGCPRGRAGGISHRRQACQNECQNPRTVWCRVPLPTLLPALCRQPAGPRFPPRRPQLPQKKGALLPCPGEGKSSNRISLSCRDVTGPPPHHRPRRQANPSPGRRQRGETIDVQGSRLVSTNPVRDLPGSLFFLPVYFLRYDHIFAITTDISQAVIHYVSDGCKQFILC